MPPGKDLSCMKGKGDNAKLGRAVERLWSDDCSSFPRCTAKYRASRSMGNSMAGHGASSVSTFRVPLWVQGIPSIDSQAITR